MFTDVHRRFLFQSPTTIRWWKMGLLVGHQRRDLNETSLKGTKRWEKRGGKIGWFWFESLTETWNCFCSKFGLLILGSKFGSQSANPFRIPKLQVPRRKQPVAQHFAMKPMAFYLKETLHELLRHVEIPISQLFRSRSTPKMLDDVRFEPKFSTQFFQLSKFIHFSACSIVFH